MIKKIINKVLALRSDVRRTEKGRKPKNTRPGSAGGGPVISPNS